MNTITLTKKERQEIIGELALKDKNLFYYIFDLIEDKLNEKFQAELEELIDSYE